MANPLQPKVIKCLEQEYNGYVVKVVTATKSGHGDVLACIKGLFYSFEVKYGSDIPSELQKDKINKCIDAGGRAYFIRSIPELRNIMDNNIPPIRYETDKRFIL